MQMRRTAAVVATTAMAAGVLAAGGAGAAPARPDLVTTKLGAVPANADPGSSFRLGATVASKGGAAAKPTAVRFYLSTDKTAGAGDVVAATVPVKKLPARRSRAVSGSITVPSTAKGLYWVIACADGTKRLKESKEKNNCRASATQVDVTADLHASLTGNLSFLDQGQRTDSATGKTETWNHTASATVKIAIDGDPNAPSGLVFNSAGSTYQRSGSVVVHQDDTDCVSHDERISSAGGELSYTGDPLKDDLTGHFTKTDLSGVSLGLLMRAAWKKTETRTPKGEDGCTASTKVTTGNELDVSDIQLTKVAATASSITYQVTGWKAEMNTASDWDEVKGTLTLTMR